ncbi:MAG: hypothetical protein JRG90_08945 [Deltaproteobacteria bacterium]|nr:hypothetical protein [Deltaproteobacteria bacterium]
MNRLALPTILCSAFLLCANPSDSGELRDPPPLPSGGSGVARPLEPAIDAPARVGEAPTALRAGAPTPLAAAGGASDAPRLAFDGIINTTVSITPPDTHIAVGRGYGSTGRVVMVTNLSAGIWDKHGNPVVSPLSLGSMFGADVFDPKVLYDQHSDRFFIVALEGKSSTPGLSVIHIAVSFDGAPDDLASDWTFLSGSAVTTVGGTSTWADYPGIGADASALFVTTNLFTFTASAFKGMKIRVFDKADLLAGIYGYSDLDYDASSIDVATTQPAHVFAATSNGAFYLISRIDASSYRLFAVSGHPSAPTATTNTFPWSGGLYPANDGADQCDQVQPDVATLSARVQSAVYRDGQIWLTLTSDPDEDGETEVVWQQIASNGYPLSNPSVTQAGYLDGTGTDAWTYLPSLNVNAAGDAAIVYTQSSATECPNMYYATRAASDSAGSFRDPIAQRLSDGFYDSFRSDNPDRWGDYAAVVIDPSDDCFWLASEFVWSSTVAGSDWGTHVANVCSYLPVPALPAPYLLGLALSLAFAAAHRYSPRGTSRHPLARMQSSSCARE